MKFPLFQSLCALIPPTQSIYYYCAGCLDRYLCKLLSTFIFSLAGFFFVKHTHTYIIGARSTLCGNFNSSIHSTWQRYNYSHQLFSPGNRPNKFQRKRTDTENSHFSGRALAFARPWSKRWTAGLSISWMRNMNFRFREAADDLKICYIFLFTAAPSN